MRQAAVDDARLRLTKSRYRFCCIRRMSFSHTELRFKRSSLASVVGCSELCLDMERVLLYVSLGALLTQARVRQASDCACALIGSASCSCCCFCSCRLLGASLVSISITIHLDTNTMSRASMCAAARRCDERRKTRSPTTLCQDQGHVVSENKLADPFAQALHAFQPRSGFQDENVFTPGLAADTGDAPTTAAEPHRRDLHEGGVDMEAGFFIVVVSPLDHLLVVVQNHTTCCQSTLASTWPAGNKTSTFTRSSRASLSQKGCCPWKRPLCSQPASNHFR